MTNYFLFVKIVQNNITYCRGIVIKNKRGNLNILIVAIIILSLATVFSFTYAWFTASHTKTGEITFATITLNILDSSDNSAETTASFETKYLNGILPGSTLHINDTKIKNTGNSSLYALMNLDITVTQTGQKTLHWNDWYNLNSEAVNTDNYAINNADATLLAPNAESEIDLNWIVPGEVVTSAYENASVKVTLTAHGVQSYLPEAKNYVDEAQYAGYFIISNSENIYNNNHISEINRKNLFDKRAVDTGHYIIEATGVVTNGASELATYNSSDYIKVKPNTTYIKSGTIGANTQGYYDANKNVISPATVLPGVPFITPNNCAYLKFNVGVSNAPYNNVQLEEGSVATEYQEYIPSVNLFNKDLNGKPSSYTKIIPTQTGIISKNTASLGSWNFALFKIGKVEDFAGKKLYLNVDAILSGVPAARIMIGYADENYENRQNFGALTFTTDGHYMVKMTVDANTYADKNIIIWLYSQSHNNTAIKDTYVEYSNVMVSTEDSNYEPYMEKANYALAYNEPLMKVGETFDTIDYTNNTMSRNIKKIVLDGTESWSNQGAVNSVYRYYISPTDLKLGYQNANSNQYKMSEITEFANVDEVCITTHPSTQQINFFVKFSTVNEWKAYLAEQYAKGDPVIVWYKLATAETETFFVGKNYYAGEQLLHHTTGASGNNTSSASKIVISKDVEAFINSSTIEMGGEFFNFIKDKTFTVSCKLKRNIAENVNSTKISIVTYSNNIQLTYRSGFIDEVPVDGQWHYIWLNCPMPINDSENVDKIIIWLADYDSNISRDFEIKDIQIEIGDTPTNFQPNN